LFTQEQAASVELHKCRSPVIFGLPDADPLRVMVSVTLTTKKGRE
jgi:hypothetical protein